MTTQDADNIVARVAHEHGLRVHQLRERAGNGKGAHWALVSQAKREAARAMRDRGASLPTIGRALNCGVQPVLHGLRVYAREHGQDVETASWPKGKGKP